MSKPWFLSKKDSELYEKSVGLEELKKKEKQLEQRLSASKFKDVKLEYRQVENFALELFLERHPEAKLLFDDPEDIPKKTPDSYPWPPQSNMMKFWYQFRKFEKQDVESEPKWIEHEAIKRDYLKSKADLRKTKNRIHAMEEVLSIIEIPTFHIPSCVYSLLDENIAEGSPKGKEEGSIKGRIYGLCIPIYMEENDQWIPLRFQRPVSKDLIKKQYSRKVAFIAPWTKPRKKTFSTNLRSLDLQ